MSTGRVLRVGQSLLPSLVRREQCRADSSVSTFFQKVKEGIESNPELKKSLDQVKQGGQGVTEGLAKAAEVARQTTAQLRQQTSKTAAAAQEQVKSTASSSSDSQAPKPDAAPQSPTDASFTAGQSAAEHRSHQSAGTASSSTASSSTHHQDQGSSRQGQTSTSESTSQQTNSKQHTSSSQAKAQKPSVMQRLRSIGETVRKEVQAAIMPIPRTESATRARPEGLRPAAPASGGPSAVMVVQQKESAWQKQWQDLQSKLGSHPFFKSFLERAKFLSNNRVVEKGRNLKEDIRERWETSDNPTVQRFQDMKENMFAETEPAQALKEIRFRDPDFDMVRFLYNLKVDVPIVIQAYLRGQVDVLKQHCSSDMLERLQGIIAAQQAQGLSADPTILDTSEVELVDVKFLEEDPVIVVQFTCQQINCSRDKFGNIVEGRPDDVQRVYYFWALSMDHAGFVGSDGKRYPPRWQLKEMMVRGMHNLL